MYIKREAFYSEKVKFDRKINIYKIYINLESRANNTHTGIVIQLRQKKISSLAHSLTIRLLTHIPKFIYIYKKFFYIYTKVYTHSLASFPEKNMALYLRRKSLYKCMLHTHTHTQTSKYTSMCLCIYLYIFYIYTFFRSVINLG